MIAFEDSQSNVKHTRANPTTAEVLALAAEQLPPHSPGVTYKVVRTEWQTKDEMTFEYSELGSPGLRLTGVAYRSLRFPPCPDIVDLVLAPTEDAQ